jgi:hypothetical protein
VLRSLAAALAASVAASVAPGVVAHASPAATLTLTTRYLPAGTDGAVYSALLGTTGASGYCSWSVVDGKLPRGLQLALTLGCQAQVVGIPEEDSPANYAFRIEVFDLVGGYASSRFSIAIGAPLPTTTSPPAPPTKGPGPAAGHSAARPNWSGYVWGGGPYKQVTGTFTVPYISTGDASCSEQFGEWVGLDGASTFLPSAGHSLVQAGIGEGMVNPYSNTCTAGQFYIWAWWEVLPKPETWVWPLSVRAGDRVSVDIAQVSRGKWEVTITDTTSGRSYSTEQPYKQAPTTAEWVVEATEVPSLCGAGVDPGLGPGICRLAPFGPGVRFSEVAAKGATTARWRVDLVQRGLQVAAPSALSGGRFSVSYTGTAPAGQGLRAPRVQPLFSPGLR